MPETTLPRQSSIGFRKHEKWATFGILAKGAPHEHLLEISNLQNGKSDIVCVTSRVDHDSAVAIRLRLLFVEL